MRGIEAAWLILLVDFKWDWSLPRSMAIFYPTSLKTNSSSSFSTRSDPRQIFFGLAPWWVVNMADKKILKPTDEKLLEYYSSWALSRGASGRRALEGVVTRVSTASAQFVFEEDRCFLCNHVFFFCLKIKNTVSKNYVEDVDSGVSATWARWHTARGARQLLDHFWVFHHLPIQVWSYCCKSNECADGLGLLCCPLSRSGSKGCWWAGVPLLGPWGTSTQSRHSKPSTQTDVVAGCECKAGE